MRNFTVTLSWHYIEMFSLSNQRKKIIKINKTLFWCGTIDNVCSTLSHRTMCVSVYANEMRQMKSENVQLKWHKQSYQAKISIQSMTTVYAGMIKKYKRKKNYFESFFGLLNFFYLLLRLQPSLSQTFFLSFPQYLQNWIFGWVKKIKKFQKRASSVWMSRDNKWEKKIRWTEFFNRIYCSFTHNQFLIIIFFIIFLFFSNWKAIGNTSRYDHFSSVEWREKENQLWNWNCKWSAFKAFFVFGWALMLFKLDILWK